MKNNRYPVRLSLKNKKLQPSERVRFLIWNLPACATCPFATEHCKSCCYARKSERCYPTVLPARKDNYADSRKGSFMTNMQCTIACYMARPTFRKAETVFFRIHESGDFYSPEYVDKWLDIMRWALPIYGKKLIFVAYTKSLPYFINDDGTAKDLPDNFSPVASVWDDTDPAMIALNNDVLHFPVYTAGTEEEVTAAVAADPANNHRCRCSDCGHCQTCFRKKKKFIFCVIH